MPQKPAIKKTWSKSRDLRVITPSRYEKNEASIKAYWKEFIANLELSYKDDKFWESNTKTVRSIVPGATFRKLAKIYNLPLLDEPYLPRSDSSSIVSSEQFYLSRKQSRLVQSRSKRSIMSAVSTEEMESLEEEEREGEGEGAEADGAPMSTSMSARSCLSMSTPSASSAFAHKSSRMLVRASAARSLAFIDTRGAEVGECDGPACSLDDLIVHRGGCVGGSSKDAVNPHYDMLRTNKTETDMITWASRYLTRQLEVSAADEFSRKAEITTKKIAKEFFDWYTAMGEVEFKSEIKRPEDIEQLFQVWFDEHASRGIVLDSRVLPCVLQTVATACGVPEASCPNVLKRQVAFDIRAESTPQHTTAFGSCLPQRMKHIPPDNNTRAQWRSVRIPQDLKTMAAVWDDIMHLSSTKEFQSWLAKRPHLPMPPCLRGLGEQGDSKPRFVIPSDFVFRASDTSVEEDLALPVSQLNVELKTVLSQLMNQ